MQNERDFVGMRCAPGNNAFELDGLVSKGADFHQFRFDSLRVSHTNSSMAHLGPGNVRGIGRIPLLAIGLDTVFCADPLRSLPLQGVTLSP